MVAVAVLLSVAIIEGSTARPQYDDYNDYDPYDVPPDQAAPSQGENQCLGTLHIAQWAKSGFFVQWVYWVYLFSQNTRPLCNAAMYEQV